MAYVELDMGGDFSAYDEATIRRESSEWAVDSVGVAVVTEVQKLVGPAGGAPVVRFVGTRDECEAIAFAYFVDEDEAFVLEQVYAP